MPETKKKQSEELIKSGLIVFIPILLMRAILGSMQATAMLKGLAAALLVIISFLIRKQIKERENNELFIFLIFILFFPAGFYYLWKYSKRNYLFKIAISIIFILLLILVKNFLGTLQ